MTKQFFIWKDPACNGINPEWIQLSGREYYRFVKDPANQQRRFIVLGDDGDMEAGTIVLEATPEAHRIWRNEKRATAKRLKLDPLYIEDMISLDAPVPGHEEVLYHEVIASTQEDILTLALFHLDIYRLCNFLSSLSEEETMLVRVLYFDNDEGVSEREIARRLNIPQKSLNNRKLRLLKKAKDFLAQN